MSHVSGVSSTIKIFSATGEDSSSDNLFGDSGERPRHYATDPPRLASPESTKLPGSRK